MKPGALPNIGMIGLIFGLSVTVSRFAVGQFEPIVFSGLRLTLATLAFAGFYGVARKRYPFPTDLKLWRHALFVGIIGTAIPTVCFITALQYQSSGVAAIIIATGPAITALMAHFTLKDEPINISRGFGIGLALSGALLLIWRGESGLLDIEQTNPIGYGLIVLALCFNSMSSIYVRKYTRDYNMFDLTGAQIFVAMAVLMVIISFTTGFDFDRVNLQGVLAIAYGGLVVMFGGVLLAFFTIQRFGATVTALSHYVTPIVASLSGMLLLGEIITIWMIAGIIIILAGVVLVNYDYSDKRSSPEMLQT